MSNPGDVSDDLEKLHLIAASNNDDEVCVESGGKGSFDYIGNF